MGKWSEDSVLSVAQSRSSARFLPRLAKERSGEEHGPLEGTLVGVSKLSKQRALLLMPELMTSPRAAARLSPVNECQSEWWALKSPMMRASVELSANRSERSGE